MFAAPVVQFKVSDETPTNVPAFNLARIPGDANASSVSFGRLVIGTEYEVR